MANGGGQIVQLIYNPSAGKHCPHRVAELRSIFEDEGARVILTECGPGCEFGIAAEATHVCALGGDGTIRHVAMAIRGCGRLVPLGIYPAGTVNLLHREIGSPVEPRSHALRLLGSEEAAPHYSAEVNETLFLACASVGPDSRAVAALSPRLKRSIGAAAYVAAFLRVLLDWRRDRITLSHEGGRISCEAFYVAKGRYFAGPWSFAPEAELRKPLLHVVALETARRRDFFRFAWTVYRGRRPDKLPRVRAFSCTSLVAEADAPLPVQADGDIVANLPARISVGAAPMPFC